MLRTNPDRKLQIAIGQEVGMLRRQRKLTYADLSATSGLLIGMLSKIENGHISPSPTTLQSLGAALSVPVTTFFRGFEATGSAQPAPAPAASEPTPD